MGSGSSRGGSVMQFCFHSLEKRSKKTILFVLKGFPALPWQMVRKARGGSLE